MRVFQQVVDDGSFAEAARTLNLSPAVATRLVSDLEDHLGARLLQRTTRRLALTDAGQAYLSRVRHILADIEEAQNLAQANTTEIAGMLRIHCPPLLASHHLAPLVPEFRRRHPKVVLDIHAEPNSNPAIEDYDITLLSAAEGFDAKIIARTIIATHSLLCASPDYLAQHGAPQRVEDLAQHACLHWRQGSQLMPWRLVPAVQPGPVVEFIGQPAFICNQQEPILSACLAGAGISAQSRITAMPYMESGELQRVLPGWISGRFTLYAALPSRKFMPARTRAFLEFFAEGAQLLDKSTACPNE